MADTDILLGIDFGTGGCKVTCVTPCGKVAGEASVEYRTWFEHQGWSEQEPADWYGAMCQALRKCAARGVDLKRVKSLSFDGSTHNAVLLDEKMKPVRRTIMWTDQRSVKECAFLKETMKEEIFSTAYQAPTPTWTLPQLMWLKANEPEIPGKTRHLLFVKDYVRYLVTGEAMTDRIEAQGTLFFDMRKMDWSRKLFALTGFDPEVLPRLISPCDAAGTVTRQAAEDTGIPEGTPVICGTSDSAVEDYGAGAVLPGDCIVKLATAGNVNVMTAEPHPWPTTLTYSHVIPGMWYTVSATNAAALCLRHVRDLLCGDLKAEAEKTGTNAFDLMDRLAGDAPAGSNGIMFHPYLQGERSPYWDPDLRASFTGISIASGKGDLLRSVLEGVAFSLLDCYGTIQEMKLGVNRIFLIGGGARSQLWSSIVCNVFGLPAAVPCPGDASYGAALLAGTGIGMFSSPREAVEKCLVRERQLEPDPVLAKQYRELFARYKAIHDALAPVYRKKTT